MNERLWWMARDSSWGFPSSSTTCGTKRPADDCDLDGDQPLAKKFGHLHLDPPAENATPGRCGCRASSTSRQPSAVNDSMLLDDTKHTVYIHDLDRELEEIESQEASVPFLSRIAEKLAPIPSSILPPRPQGNELVLYREPTSLTVPKNQDSVRKAVMESRERARKAQNGNQDSNPDPWPRWSEARRTSGMNGEATEEADDDRMDVDGL